MIHILLADDHMLVREGLKQLLAGAGDVEVAAEAVNGDEALAHVRERDFDLVMLDMSMPGLSGIELIKRMRIERPRVRILVLSMHGEQQYAARAFKAGASGYLTKDSASAQLVAAIRKIAAGGVYVSPKAAEQLATGAMQQDSALPHTMLSDREYEVFRLLVEGRSPTEIADALNLSVKTVSTHKARLLQKMNAHSTAELVRYAVEHKLDQDSP